MQNRPDTTERSDRPLTLGVLGRRDLPAAVRIAARTFAHVAPEKELRRLLRAGTDPTTSLALRRGSDVVGVYLVRIPHRYFPFRDVAPPDYPGLKGRRLDLLALLPGLRGAGYGRLLRAAARADALRDGYDYVWGAAMDALANRGQWLKLRALEREVPGGFVSLDPLGEKARRAFASMASDEALATWRRDDAEEEVTLSGRLVIQRLAAGGRIPWLVSPEGAHAGALVRDDVAALDALGGADMDLRTRIRGNSFDAAILPQRPRSYGP